MKIELTKEEINLLFDVCFEELYNIGKLQYSRFVDKKAVCKRIESIKMVMDKLNIDK